MSSESLAKRQTEVGFEEIYQLIRERGADTFHDEIIEIEMRKARDLTDIILTREAIRRKALWKAQGDTEDETSSVASKA